MRSPYLISAFGVREHSERQRHRPEPQPASGVPSWLRRRGAEERSARVR
jgi:hypothetical protein